MTGVALSPILTVSNADTELVSRVLAGDERAFAELFHAHRHEVFRVARAVTGS